MQAGIIFFIFLLFFHSLGSTQCIPTFSLFDALAFTLNNQLSVKIFELNVEAQAGVVQHNAGPFDPVLDGLGQITIFDDLQLPNLGIKTDCDGFERILNANVTKKNRIGTIFNLSAQVDQICNQLLFPAETNIGTLSFQIEQPLLRNFLYGTDTINEQASILELYAVQLETFQNLSQLILNTSNRYWDVIYYKHFIQISKQAEIRISRLIDDLKELIKEDQIARSDIHQPYEQLAEQEQVTLQATKEYYNAVQELKFAMGNIDLNVCDPDKLNLLDDFPYIHLDIQKFRNMTGCWMHYATTYRYDVQASMMRVEEANVLLLGATNQTLPEVNAFAGVTRKDFTQRKEARKFFSSLDMDKPETDWSLGLRVSIPLYNDSAIGTYRQIRAQRYQAVFQSELLVQSAIRDLREAINDQISLAKELKQANEIVLLNMQLIDDERKKLKAGFSTIFVLLNFETRLTDSLISKADILRLYMQNIARIRLLTGTMFQSDSNLKNIKLADITTFPGLCCDYNKPRR